MVLLFPKNLSESAKSLLQLYDLFPFHKHPLWIGVQEGTLEKQQIILAEGQHYLRTKAGQVLRKEAMEKCLSLSNRLWEAIIETYLEECTEEDGTPTHLELIQRLLYEGGVDDSQQLNLIDTPGNAAAKALYKDISARGAGCHIIGAGMVEWFYSQLSPKVFSSYTNNYKFTEFAAETYKIHGVMDQTHAARAFEVVDEAVRAHGFDLVESSVRDAFVAISLHYDGMLQAATGKFEYWNGN